MNTGNNQFEDWIKKESGLGDTLSAFNLFSVFLEWNIMNPTTPDLSCAPIEYIRYIAYAGSNPEAFSEIVLLVMLFSEHTQLTFTGTRKLVLEEKKYHQIAEQFAIACKMELLKRQDKISNYSVFNLFNPNIKTQIHISQTDLKKLPDSIKESIQNLLSNERHTEQQ